MRSVIRVLVVDDDRVSRESTAIQLRAAGYSADAVGSAAEALRSLETGDHDVVLTDVRMPEMDGLELLRALREARPAVDVLLMTAFGSIQSAVEAMRAGAVDYLTKPFPFAELDLRLHRIAEARAGRRELERLRDLVDQAGGHGLVGRSLAMQRVRDQIALFARHGAPLLITGATGTGKEIVSRAIHAGGPRCDRPFVAVACGAIPRDLAETYFFGHEKGAFTGAIQRRKGCFEQADGGTLLLDDVDDLPLDIQVKLLRVLQEARLTRVGGTEDVKVDVRIIATTKVALDTEVEHRRFREDLYYRLRGLQIDLPPLRDRGDDVVLLAVHFLRLLAADRDGPPCSLSHAVADALRCHPWPGGVRELRRVMEAADALAGGGEIRIEHVPMLATPVSGPRGLYSLHLEGVERLDLAGEVQRFEDELVRWAMRTSGGTQVRAAEMLGVARTTLQNKLARR